MALVAGQLNLSKNFPSNKFSIAPSLDGDISHRTQGTVYGEGAAVVYSHGPDGDFFLNPVLELLLKEAIFDGTTVVDLGCGSANEAIRAAQLGATVFGIDFQALMTAEGQRKVDARRLQNRVTLATGDASDLSDYTDIKERDLALSILVGCNLPKGTFENYFIEMGRILASKGKAIVVLPSSLDQIFTKGNACSEKAKRQIEVALRNLPDNPSPQNIEAKLKTFTDVNSATFVMKEKRLTLVIDKSLLIDGQKIWRKLPNLVIPNIYWSEKKYETAFTQGQFNVTRVVAPYFRSDVQRRGYNFFADDDHSLGATYAISPIFKTFILEKR